MITLWHYPRCSKSRQTLALVRNSCAAVTVRNYLEDIPSEDEIAQVIKALGIASALDMMRTSEDIFKQLGLSKDSPDDQLIKAMTENPILIERPIAIKGGKAVIGRPPETVKTLLP